MNVKRNFEIACTGAGISKAGFAARMGISKGTLGDVLAGRIKSARVSRAVEQFTSRQFKRLRLHFASCEKTV